MRADWALRGILVVPSGPLAVPRHTELEKDKEVSRALKPPDLGEECEEGGGGAEKHAVWGQELEVHPFIVEVLFLCCSFVMNVYLMLCSQRVCSEKVLCFRT